VKRALLCLMLVGMFAFALLEMAAPASAATNPTLASSNGTSGLAQTLLEVSLATGNNDSLVVYEWVGIVFGNNACSYISPPTDSNTNTWSAVGSCVADANGGAMEAFAATGNPSNDTDSINCNYGGPNSLIESCYAFDIKNPGTITLFNYAIGQNENAMGVPLSTAAANSLLLQTAGIEFFCGTVTPYSAATIYIPASACDTPGNPQFQYGMAGTYAEIGAGGLTTSSLMYASQSQIVWVEIVVQIAAPTTTTTTTQYTATITGFLAPDAAHISNSMTLFIYPLAGMIVMLVPLMMFQKPREIGDKAIYPCLFGLLVGAAAADLSTGTGTALQVPFADLIVAALMLFLWWWSS
jgi:hypothetical protein